MNRRFKNMSYYRFKLNALWMWPRVGMIFMLWLTSFWAVTLHARQAGMDLEVALNSRYYPLALTVKAEVGLSRYLWRQQEDWQYGFARIAGSLEGIAGYSAQGFVAEIFPISLVGLRMGREWMDNHQDYKDYNCDNYVCRGQFAMAFIELPIYVGYAGLFVHYSWRSETWEATDPHQETGRPEYVEPSTGLPLSVSSLRGVIRQRFLVMYALSENWRVGVIEAQAAGDATDVGYKSTRSRMRAVVGQWRADDLIVLDDEVSLFFGVGEFQSPLAHSDPTAFLGVRFAPWPKLGF